MKIDMVFGVFVFFIVFKLDIDISISKYEIEIFIG